MTGSQPSRGVLPDAFFICTLFGNDAIEKTCRMGDYTPKTKGGLRRRGNRLPQGLSET